MTIEQHQDAMLHAFARVVQAEERQRQIEIALAATTSEARIGINQAQQEQSEGWSLIQALMAETGEVEVTLPGQANDFRIGWSSPRESVKADPEATPDEFCQIIRKPRLKEIGDFLKQLRDQNLPFPNWASFERGEPKLQYKLVKKGAA